MTYILKEIFGDTKRISILEELIERWGEFLKASEIARMSDVSKRTVYDHLNELENIGLLETKRDRAVLYRLKKDDPRALALAMLETEESLRQTEINITHAENEEEVVEKYKKSVLDYFKDGQNFSSSKQNTNFLLKAVLT